MNYEMARQLLGLPTLMEVPSVVVIEPHPDDNEVGAGGLVKRWTDAGVAVTFLTVTDGRAGTEDPTGSAEQMVRTRMGERQRASQMLGVQASYNLGFEDGGDWSERDVMLTLVPLLRQFRPALVLTVDPWTPYESHPDHVKTGKAVSTALIYAKNGIVLQGQGEPYDVPQIAFYGSAYPNQWVDVSETWTTKLEALLAHSSQFDTPAWPMISGFFTAEAERLYREHVNPEGTGYAEAFKVLTSMQMHFFPDAVRS